MDSELSVERSTQTEADLWIDRGALEAVPAFCIDSGGEFRFLTAALRQLLARPLDTDSEPRWEELFPEQERRREKPRAILTILNGTGRYQEMGYLALRNGASMPAALWIVRARLGPIEAGTVTYLGSVFPLQFWQASRLDPLPRRTPEPFRRLSESAAERTAPKARHEGSG